MIVNEQPRALAPADSRAGSRASLAALFGSGLSRNALGTMALRGSFYALDFLCGLLIARVFGASSFGVYALVGSWIAVLGTPAAAGFDRLVLREVAMYRARGEWSLVRGILERSRGIVLGVSIMLALAVGIVVSLVPRIVPPGALAALQVGLIVVPFVAFGRLRQAALQGLGRVTLGQVPETLVQPLVLFALIGALLLTGGVVHSGLLAVSMYAISAAVACLAGVFILRFSLPSAVREAAAEYQTRAWVRSAAPFVWMLGMNALVTNADTIIVGYFEGATSAGVYRLVSQAAMLVAFPLTCINMAVAPSIASHYARGDVQALQSIATNAARAILIASVPVAIGLIVLGPKVLQLFGPQFAAGYSPLVILCTAYLLNAAAGTAGYLLIMTRYENGVAVVFTCGAVVNVVGNFILIPLAGIEGAAIASALGVIVVSVAFIVLVRRRLEINPTALTMRHHPDRGSA